ncbi:MAG TPA: dihydrofolate reductase family protein [Solirubrobacteraceae bacterium]|jgi:riboflavin biosynthesis pyrimidine reductase|nr:dihydrofolate reductase family protein [Solirubrobacteraceae bacterium]
MGSSDAEDPAAAAPAPAPPRLTPLLPAGEPASAADTVAGFGLWERESTPPPRPRVLLNMVSSADGRATLAGRSGPLSSPADRELFHALRACSDAILVGAGTVRGERYGPTVPDPRRQELRRAHGLDPQPPACIVTASVRLDPAIPLLDSPESRVLVLTASEESLPPTRASVDYLRCAAGGNLDLAAAFARLAAEHGVQLLLCEGGPHLGAELLAAGLLDELYLAIAPKLLGTAAPQGADLRILAGAELEPPAEMELAAVLASDSHVFLRYVVVSAECVSRETTASSSLAR